MSSLRKSARPRRDPVATTYGYGSLRGKLPRPSNDNRRSSRRRSVPLLLGAWFMILAAITALFWRSAGL
ncbi:hypothetical protein [Methylobacterium sp. ID0610]|uniref:hypothetical protein n=1 Tax=Methylobacterium carpenticola TaxID=3344827 RepID=UPI00369C3435